MAAPVSRPAAPGPVGPAADPAAIRACLTPDVAAVFDAEWELVLEAAKASQDLAGVHELLGKWRFVAHQELKDPGSYFRLLATAARTIATGGPPAGSVSAEEVRAVIQARLGR